MSSYEGKWRLQRKVRNKLQSIGFPEIRTKVKKGWVKETTKSADLPDRVAFAYVDLDLYDPIKDALNFLDTHATWWTIIVDDYGFFSEGAELAVDQFVSKSGNRFNPRYRFPSPGTLYFE